MEQVLYLINECKVPLKTVQRRLKLKRGLVERLRKCGEPDPNLFER